MLVIQMPEKQDKKRKRRRLRAAAYAIPGLLILASLILSRNLGTLCATIAVETWWLWAISTDERLNK